MIAGNDVDLPALGGQTGVFHGHLSRQRRTGSAEVGVEPGLIGQRADLHGLVLSERASTDGECQRDASQKSQDSIIHILSVNSYFEMMQFRRRGKCEACP